MLSKFQALDADYKALHLQVIDLIDETDEEAFEEEQGRIDKLDDDVSNMTVRLQALMTTASATAPDASPLDRRPLTRKLSGVNTGLNRIERVTTETDELKEPGLLSHYFDELSYNQKDLATIYSDLAVEDINDDDELFVTHSAAEALLSTLTHKIKFLLVPTHDGTPSRPTFDGTGVRLQKLEVPTNDGNIIHWKRFWEQFAVAVHNKTSLSNAEKTVYLQQAIRTVQLKVLEKGYRTLERNTRNVSSLVMIDLVLYNTITLS